MYFMYLRVLCYIVHVHVDLPMGNVCEALPYGSGTIHAPVCEGEVAVIQGTLV